MEQANKAVQRWKNRSGVERRRTLGTERDLYQAKFLKNVTALGLQRPATSNAITRKWHFVPVSNSGYYRRLSCFASWMACPSLRIPSLRSDRSTQKQRWCQWRVACPPRMAGSWQKPQSCACHLPVKSRRNWFSFTRTPASRQIRASAGVTRGFKKPTREHADLW